MPHQHFGNSDSAVTIDLDAIIANWRYIDGLSATYILDKTMHVSRDRRQALLKERVLLCRYLPFFGYIKSTFLRIKAES